LIEFRVQGIAPNPSGIAIISCRQETRDRFPPPGQPFILIIDGMEYRTSIRNLQSGWTSFAKTFHEENRIPRAELCERHRLREGDRVFIEIIEPRRRYRLRRHP
jgi:hypothetical protein